MIDLRIFFIGLASAALLIGCESSSLAETTPETALKVEPKTPSPKMPDKDTANNATRTLQTTMTDEGVECPAVRGADNTLYTVTNMPANFKVGDRLNIDVPHPIEPMASFCQQGQTIAWTRIELISPDGTILKYWDR